MLIFSNFSSQMHVGYIYGTTSFDAYRPGLKSRLTENKGDKKVTKV